MDILVYAGLFLPEQNPELPNVLTEKAESGARVRILFGDPDSPHVAERGREEGIGDAIRHKIRNVMVHYRGLEPVSGIEVRVHRTNLYNSVYRFDNDMLINLHVYGLAAAHAPMMHLRRLAEARLFTTYYQSFERVWAESAPAWT
ncbi:MAG: DUF5919 domain-containing protein [Chloroflexia bacterium]